MGVSPADRRIGNVFASRQVVLFVFLLLLVLQLNEKRVGVFVADGDERQAVQTKAEETRGVDVEEGIGNQAVQCKDHSLVVLHVEAVAGDFVVRHLLCFHVDDSPFWGRREKHAGEEGSLCHGLCFAGVEIIAGLGQTLTVLRVRRCRVHGAVGRWGE